jgi:hypothetical protein
MSLHRDRLQHMESDHLCTCNSQRTAGIDADRTLDGVCTRACTSTLHPKSTVLIAASGCRRGRAASLPVLGLLCCGARGRRRRSRNSSTHQKALTCSRGGFVPMLRGMCGDGHRPRCPLLRGAQRPLLAGLCWHRSRSRSQRGIPVGCCARGTAGPLPRCCTPRGWGSMCES